MRPLQSPLLHQCEIFGCRPMVIMLLCLAVGLAATRRVGAQEVVPRELVVIVNPANPVNSLGKDFIRRVFLKKLTRWDNDETIRPVDLSAKSEVRWLFCVRVLERSIDAVKSYWQQRIFSGRDIPPPELASEEAVVDYVKRYPGAIGYVSKATNLVGTKVLTVNPN